MNRLFPALKFVSPVGALQAPGDFLDLSGRVTSGGETGLLGAAFHPQFPSNPRVYVSYTALEGTQLVSRLSEFQSRDNGLTLDPASEVILLHVIQPEANHNGGHVLLGPDGFLYLGLGDGGGAGDAHGTIGNGQDLNTLLGKILRIDINNGTPYAIPADNPNHGSAACGAGPTAVGTGTAPCAEIYAWGLRNPWQFSFDRQGGALWIADVGQDLWEEVDRITSPANLG